MNPLALDFTGCTDAFVDAFARERHRAERAALHAAAAEQQAAAVEHNLRHRSLDGLGRPRLSVSSTSFHYWGRRLGYDCWRDPQFLREFERDNPAARIVSGGTKDQFGYQSPVISDQLSVIRTDCGAKRFRKTYPTDHRSLVTGHWPTREAVTA